MEYGMTCIRCIPICTMSTKRSYGTKEARFDEQLRHKTSLWGRFVGRK